MTRTQTSRLVLAMAGIGVLAIAFGTIHFTRPAWYQRFWYPLRYGEIVRGHAHNYDLDPALLAAVIYQESKFESHARSDRGAIGLMQLLPETAKGIAARTGGSKFRVADLYNPEINVRYGAWYLEHLMREVRRRARRARRVQRRPGERGLVAKAGAARPVRGDAALRRPGREAERHLPGRLFVTPAARRHLTNAKVMS